MESQEYVKQLKKRQLDLLGDYSKLVKLACSESNLEKPGFLQEFRKREESCLNRFEYLADVINAFGSSTSGYIDFEIYDKFEKVREDMETLKSLIKEKKAIIKRKTRSYLLKNNRRNILYREIKPAYIDMHT